MIRKRNKKITMEKIKIKIRTKMLISLIKMIKKKIKIMRRVLVKTPKKTIIKKIRNHLIK